MRILRKIYRRLIKYQGLSKCRSQANPLEPKKVFVTLFHDFEGEYSAEGRGKPCLEAARSMLNAQNQLGIRCTYNTVAKLAIDIPDFMAEVNESGNEIASHSYEHKLLSEMTRQKQESDIIGARDAFDTLGYTIKGLRCPQSSWSNSIMKGILNAGYKWSAENGDEPFPYIYLRNARDSLWRFPVRGDDWMYISDNLSPGEMLGYWKNIVELERGRGRYAAIGFHPWIESTKERIDAYYHFLKWLKEQKDVEVLPFGEILERIN